MPRPVHFEIQAENVERAIVFCREFLGRDLDQWGKEPCRLAGMMQMDANAK